MNTVEQGQTDIVIDVKKKPDKTKQKYSIEKLRAHCRKLFGVSSNAFDGATVGLQGEFTKDEMAQIIKVWSGKPVKKKKGGK